ncbi:MAG: hypothetical protein E6G90_17445 [Alphaproteobacteria bacterium]|nr:MAG: hypothetical protein E6G90_17445 [Alphaproteobacteria bacterium]
MGNANAGARALVLPFPQATSAYGADTVAAALTRATEGSRSTRFYVARLANLKKTAFEPPACITKAADRVMK